jgi:hypothetical protein
VHVDEESDRSGPTGARERPAAESEAVPWWAAAPARLGVLLVVLACVASVGIPRIIHNATAGRRSGCLPGPIPQAASLNAAEIQEAVSVMGVDALVGDGTVDMRGVQGPMSAWSDAYPGADPAQLTTPGRMPGGYEIRWFSPGRHHQAVDLFVFPDKADAAEFVRQAASTRCRRDAVAVPLAEPAGARGLVWHNPDGALEADVLFARSDIAYRVVEVPPRVRADGSTGGEQAAHVAVAARLACHLSSALCAG